MRKLRSLKVGFDKLRIATRGSRLALWQADYVRSLILQKYPAMQVELLQLKTKGDVIQDVPLSKIGGKGLFVKEIEEALLDGRADLAVHSMKDLPMLLPEGLCIGAVPIRGAISDIFLSEKYSDLSQIPEGGLVGTSSLRRQAQVLNLRPDLRVNSLRGNVDSRLKKMQQGHFDAIIMATAGIQRLGLECTYASQLEESTFYPACGQGALGVELRSDKVELLELISFMDDRGSRLRVEAERAFLRTLNGGCQAPIAAWTILDAEDQLTLFGMVSDLDGSNMLRKKMSAQADAANALGVDVAEAILADGGRDILEQFY